MLGGGIHVGSDIEAWRCGWLVRLVLVGLIAVDALIIIGDVFRGERVGLDTFGTAVAVIAFCTLVWYGISWGRCVPCVATEAGPLFSAPMPLMRGAPSGAPLPHGSSRAGSTVL